MSHLVGNHAYSQVTWSTDYISYGVQLAFTDSSWGVERYSAAAVRLPDGTYVYVVPFSGTLDLLPMTLLDDSVSCTYSYEPDGANPFLVNMTVYNLNRKYCAAVCRERNYPHGALHNVTCACLAATPTSPSFGECTHPCEGDVTETCGGFNPIVLPFNYVNTDVNTKVFDAPLSDGTSITVSEAIEVSFIARQVIYGFNVSVTSPLVSDVSVELVLHFRNEACNGTNLLNKTHQETFIIPPSPGFYDLQMEPILVQCLYINVYETATGNPLPNTLTFTPSVLEGGFITADYLVIETSWEIASGELCECECWVYDLLYGDSPFTNLSYTEIEKALENVTKQIEKELSVNRSELSSTIRKLTSAEDNRTSAVAVGYTLGVAMLTCIFGAIILADLPRIYEGFKTLRHNLRSRFYPETTVNNVSMERIPSLPQPDD
ncbi:uncharacterized protein LOC128232939 [Mya arenaria]|uniref:uncharacterized protein LOC128232939 n=1 Tax=Mya arenaria TaxID=6604 RepID=UPI0022E04803|nr:uncharacterized protein LOC128232939 [Mya arenaria]